jgi:hypothetical protein
MSDATKHTAGETDQDVCACICHDTDRPVMHFFPCCDRCPTCKRQIRSDRYLSHRERCDALARAGQAVPS